MLTQINRKKINNFYKGKSLENAPNKNYFGKKHGNLNYSMKATKDLESMVKTLKVVIKIFVFRPLLLLYVLTYLEDSTMS